jgi:leucyl/phenylalanyl-tRNA---protein transferase
MTYPIRAEDLLHAYIQGYFPMAMSRADPNLYWFNPDPRAILPLDALHIPRSLKHILKNHSYHFTLNAAFEDVMLGCAENRAESWINPTILALYTQLHRQGYAVSLEVWDTPSSLIGGIYGVSLGGAFFGESMFSRVSNASKLALVTLANALRKSGYTLFDVQYQNDHIRQFGVIEIPREEYLQKLNRALATQPDAIVIP